MYVLHKPCYGVSAVRRRAGPCAARVVVRVGRRVATPVAKPGADYVTGGTDNDDDYDASHEACRKVFFPIYKERLRRMMTQYFSCFYRVVYEGEDVVGKEELSAELTQKLDQVLQSTGYEQPLKDFASGLNYMYVVQYEDYRLDGLRSELKQLYNIGVADLLEPRMPEGAAFIRQHDKFLGLLDEIPTQ